MTRYCFALKVRAELQAEYRQRHAAVWPDMLHALRRSGWRNYSLFARPDGLIVGEGRRAGGVSSPSRRLAGGSGGRPPRASTE